MARAQESVERALDSKEEEERHRARKEGEKRMAAAVEQHGVDNVFDGDWNGAAGQFLLRWYSHSDSPECPADRGQVGGVGRWRWHHCSDVHPSVKRRFMTTGRTRRYGGLGQGPTALARLCLTVGVSSIVFVMIAGVLPPHARDAIYWLQRTLVIASVLTLLALLLKHFRPARRPGLTEVFV
ncbi:hypothetical protein [Streptomyces werraensis]|uniref:hypothetical protein n=1 Tax=Streptomyces werraensis TaxID=68284 RepID=UPI003439F515